METAEKELHERERRRSEAVDAIQSRIDEIEKLQREHDALSAQAIITGEEPPEEPDASELPTLMRRLSAVKNADDPELEYMAERALEELQGEAAKLRERITEATQTVSEAWQAYRETVSAGEALNTHSKQLSRRVSRIRDIAKIKKSIGVPVFDWRSKEHD